MILVFNIFPRIVRVIFEVFPSVFGVRLPFIQVAPIGMESAFTDSFKRRIAGKFIARQREVEKELIMEAHQKPSLLVYVSTILTMIIVCTVWFYLSLLISQDFEKAAYMTSPLIIPVFITLKSFFPKNAT